MTASITTKRRALNIRLLGAMVLVEIGYVLFHAFGHGTERDYPRGPALIRLLLCATSVAFVVAALALAKRGCTLARGGVFALATITTLVVGHGLYGTLQARAHPRQEPWWIRAATKAWIGSPLPHFELHPWLGYAPFWLVFATWAISLPHGDRRARALFLTVLWILTGIGIGMRINLVPISDIG